jgi:Flp pilus assembly protein TadD
MILALVFMMLASNLQASEPERAVLVKVDDVLDNYGATPAELRGVLSTLNDLSGPHGDSWAVWLRLAVTHARLGDFNQARTAAERVLQIDGNNIQAVAVRGMVAWQQSRLADADSDFDRVLAKKPRHPVANSFKAQSLIQQGKFADAIEAARNALVGNPRDLNAYALIAYAYYRQKDYDMARLVAKSSMEISDQFPDVLTVLGLVEHATDNLGLAGRQLRRAASLEPGHLEIQLNLAAFALQINDFNSALGHLDRITESQPNHKLMLLSKGVALRGLKRFAEAEAAYSRVLELEPANVEARYNLCVLKQEYTQDLDGALNWCSDFLGRIDDNHPKRKEVQNRVSGMEAAIEMMRESTPTENNETEKQEGGEN